MAVLSAFPAELAPHLERATIHDTILVENHVFHVGVLDGVPVVLALTGIGLVNAATTTRMLLERFDVQGVVFSGVAGSTQLHIGDVAVPVAWAATDGTTYAAQQEWLDRATAIAGSATVSLDRCTVVASAASEEQVCLPQEPAVVVGGVGQSSDPFGGKPFPCQPGGGDLYGCDVDLAPTPAPAAARDALTAHAAAAPESPVVNDMETAAVAREVAAHNLPFIAFRAVSDGPGDPLGLPGFLAQFTAYYPLAARNASAAMRAFLVRAVPTGVRAPG